MSRVDTALKAEHIYITGGSGTGKSSFLKEKLKHAKRVLVFDPDDEYSEISGFIRIEKHGDLAKYLSVNRNKNVKIAFVGGGKESFEFWAKCAFSWGNCLAIAEEIADVTTPAKAPPAWGKLIRRGRKYGITVCAVTQSPAEADKTILRNAAVIRCFALGRDADRRAVANEMNTSVEHIAKMVPLDFIEFRRADLSLRKGNLKHKRTATLAA